MEVVVGDDRVKVTVRLPKDLFERLRAFERASGGVPQNTILVKILEKALPKKKR